ncbi:SURF1 family protein [Simplicispira suum]|uniref:SURF1 family protein n=1 Tax=Simplicispira suum TaxID=2109915 RepID=UPI003B84743B
MVSASFSLRSSLRLWLVSLAACAGILSTGALGRWQWERAAEKEALAAELAARSVQAPLAGAELQAALAPRTAESNPDKFLFHSVKLHGRWLPKYTVYLDNRQMDGHQGFFVITPLQLAGQDTVVLVQRGWAPRNFLERTALPPVLTPEGEVEVNGHLVAETTPIYALGSGQGEQGFLRIRQNLSLDAFRAETSLALAGLVVVQDGAPSEGLLRHWLPPDTGVQKNYGYVFQWFALCGLISGLYVWFQFIRPRRHRA